ncbi:DUF1690-domain-containing protein [Microthyrium microscopicum]|uniref:DUF1690-domain-containing protein n=1 Tax=Microthyrium microscopicum TaxID=703497 RepID=A0A6A6U2I0_9PEZI|nr:DUF1690-domain-containing protein [Microthyrium microscopicum]
MCFAIPTTADENFQRTSQQSNCPQIRFIMGAETSKPATEPPQHIFAASAPTTFSPSFLNNLETSPQTDSTRSANIELKVQARLKSELEKLASEESQKLLKVTQSIPLPDDEAPKSSNSFLSNSPVNQNQDSQKSQRSHESVSKEIELLKKKLTGRKKLEEPDADVEKARDGLVTCLRINDRKPLNCWEEKEKFRREVARLEKKFVDKTIR